MKLIIMMMDLMLISEVQWQFSIEFRFAGRISLQLTAIRNKWNDVTEDGQYVLIASELKAALAEMSRVMLKSGKLEESDWYEATRWGGFGLKRVPRFAPGRWLPLSQPTIKR